MLTIGEAAELLGMHPSSLHKAIAQGRLSSIRKGLRMVLIHRDEVIRYQNTPRERGGRPKKDKGQAE